jgi:hypothetical protein
MVRRGHGLVDLWPDRPKGITVNRGTRSDVPKAAGTGVIRGNAVTCRYSIFQPAVTQWVAIGVVSFEDGDAAQLAVETAANPKDVLIRLRARVVELNARQNRRKAALPGHGERVQGY